MQLQKCLLASGPKSSPRFPLPGNRNTTREEEEEKEEEASLSSFIAADAAAINASGVE